MSRTFAAAATGLPALRSTALPELEGTALRLHVSPVTTAIWSDGPRGYALLSLCPGDDPDEPAALVRLPLAQVEALERATAAFNAIMDAAERESSAQITASQTRHVADDVRLLQRESVAPKSEITTPPPAPPRAQALVTAAAQVAVLAGVLPAVIARCLGLL